MDANDNLKNIRLQLLWDKVRSLNTNIPEEMYQRMKALSVKEWIDLLHTAGLAASDEDLATVHDWLWPVQK
jgi:hypothetical protein